MAFRFKVTLSLFRLEKVNSTYQSRLWCVVRFWLEANVAKGSGSEILFPLKRKKGVFFAGVYQQDGLIKVRAKRSEIFRENER